MHMHTHTYTQHNTLQSHINKNMQTHIHSVPIKDNTTTSKSNNSIRYQHTLVIDGSQYEMSQLPRKRHKLTEYLWNQDPSIGFLSKIYLSIKDRLYFRVKYWKSMHQPNGHKKLPGVATLISNKTDFKLKLIRRDGKVNTDSKWKKIQFHDISVINIYSWYR